MKKTVLYSFRLLLLVNLMLIFATDASSQEDSIVAEPVVKLHYYTINNSEQYILLESMLKKGKVLTPQPQKKYELYLDTTSTENLVGSLSTDARGRAKAFLPPSLKSAWENTAQHVFIVKEGEKDIITDFTITKAKIGLDTSSADGVRTISVSVKKLAGTEWVPVPDAEMKAGVSRLGGILPAGDEATYTTDSSGTVAIEFKKENLPGDEKGNIILAARLEEHEELGNLLIEQVVPWGSVQLTDHSFFEKRTLWSTRFRTPIWLMAIAYSVVLSVWGTLIYLILQLLKIKRIGRRSLIDQPSYHSTK
ncbi:MAG TPA: hypothetical protein VMZ03_11415 [Chitinophagaceae bacterium]|nr:hypothetical protein [Chitinophagaceae bacterium]